jgi:hypothetical protein
MKFVDWARMKEMDSRSKSEINTETTFTEQRKEEEESSPKEFGIKEMSEHVNIEWDNENKSK